MAMIACPGCGMPRDEELVGASPCPVCGPPTSAEVAPVSTPSQTAPPDVQQPVAFVPSRLRSGIVLGFALGLLTGIGGLLAWQASQSPDAHSDGSQPQQAAGTNQPSVDSPEVGPPPREVVSVAPMPREPRPVAEVPLPKSEKSKSTGLELALIPAGSFRMGSWEFETSRRADEHEHRVRLTRRFYLGVYEVTQDEYKQVMDVAPSWFASTGGGKNAVVRWTTERFPVETVTWFDAVDFCNRLSKLDGFDPYYELANPQREGQSIIAGTVTVRGGNGYRLPTEAEWEHACRAGTKTPFHYGSDNTGREANVKAPIVASGYGSAPRWAELGRTAKVGSYPANPWGLHDMHGNVAEWCWDWYHSEYYIDAPTDDPTGPEKGRHRVVRGGHWLVNDASCRSASRYWLTPDDSKNFAGFRVARTP